MLSNLPQSFIGQMRSLLGDAEWGSMLAALGDRPAVSVRHNPWKKPMPDSCLKGSIALGQAEQVAWSTSGYYLDSRPDFTHDPRFHAGAYYVQEASSMFVEQALRMCGKPGMVLDLCAAPGGKSTLLRSLLPDDCLLVCNEPVRARANVLAENIAKWGHEGCLISCNQAADIVASGVLFDTVLVDAPCSGEGMFRKDYNPAAAMWSTDNVEMCAARQREIVEAIWPALKAGGYLIYSTCTYNTRENEENVRYFCDYLGAETVEIPVEAEWNITGSLLKGFHEPVYRFLPHKTRGEGFFLALLRKQGEQNIEKREKRKEKIDKCSTEDQAWLNKIDASDMVAVQTDDKLCAVMSEYAEAVAKLQRSLYLLHAGVVLCERKGNKLVPHQSLALSRRLRADAFSTCPLTLEQALCYLRREAIRVDAPRGYTLVSYEGMPLGFVNNLGNRANNLYPSEWRIRH